MPCSHIFMVGGFCGGVCGGRVFGVVGDRPYCEYHYKSWGLMVGRFHERTGYVYGGGLPMGYGYSP